MKDFWGLQLSLLLCVIFTFSEQESVSVGCTCSTFWAMVEPALLGQDQVLHPDEVSLGTGCPVTEVTVRGYKFNYPVTECGIQKEVFSYGVIFYSALYYNIMSKGVTGKIPLMCIVSRKCGKCSLDQDEDLLSSSEDCRMNISCSMDWVMVSVGPCAYSSSLYIFADELYLGLGCPVTRIQTYAYDFIYPVHDCGIRTKAIEILSGTVILVLGVFLGSLQGIFDFFGYFSFFTFYSGYPIWGPIYFIFTGSSSIAVGRIPKRFLMDVKIGRYLVSTAITVVGIVLLSVNLFLTNEWLKNCPLSGSPCLYMGTSNNAIEILSGAIILVLGVFLGSLQGLFNFFRYFSFFTFYTGYLIWGPVCFIFSGSSSIAVGRKPRRILVRLKYVRNLVSAIISLVGFVLLSANLALNIEWLESCLLTESEGLCLYMGISNNAISSPPNLVESGMPPEI